MTRQSKARIWTERVAAFEGSGLSRRAWCAAHGLNPATLDYWRKRLRGVADAVAAPGLIPIVVSSQDAVTMQTGHVRIELPHGVSVQADARVDATWLASLLRGVIGC
jgi:hypothetical protein